MGRITDINQLDLEGTYSYADYLTWQFKERVELFKGKVLKMSPAPSVKHQRAASNLHYSFRSHFKSNQCQIFFAPFDVRLYDRRKSSKANKEIYTVVQPDLCVICDEKKLDTKGCNGAPDLVIEILSPGNTKREMDQKYELYQEAGVKEYWLVEPADEAVFVYTLNEEGVYIGLKPATTTLVSRLFPDLVLELNEVFA
jgi:Uma2 family endonuclease